MKTYYRYVAYMHTNSFAQVTARNLEIKFDKDHDRIRSFDRLSTAQEIFTSERAVRYLTRANWMPIAITQMDAIMTIVKMTHVQTAGHESRAGLVTVTLICGWTCC